MDKEYEKKYHELESTEWWFLTRREAVLKFVKEASRGSSILDVGCASGHLLQNLKELGFKEDHLFGIDISEVGIEVAQSNGFTQTEIMDGSKLSYVNNQFDIVISSDSLEHMEFDERALSHWFRVLKPGGKLIVFVPAFMTLWSAHDIINHHYKRYTKTILSSMLEKTGFIVVKKGYWNFFLFLPIALVRVLKRGELKNQGKLALEDDLSKTTPIINWLLKSLLRFENLMLPFFSFPFGVSTFCIAEKPKEKLSS